MPTRERTARIQRLLSLRQPDLHVILEGVSIAHNASAVIRTCDAAGVLHLHLVSPHPELLAINRAISTRAEKWLEIHLHDSIAECLTALKKNGFAVAVTHLGKNALDYTELDYKQPLALVFGSESEGVSSEALALADREIRIPMFGMVQSLNLSVSVGIILFEAVKQRRARGFYEHRRMTDEDYEAFLKKWLKAKDENDGG